MSQENNKLIAVFMQIPKCGRCEDCGAYQYSATVIYQPEDMKYHTSWDWLMQVVEKIESLNSFRNEVAYLDHFYVSIFGRMAEISCNNKRDSPNIVVWRKSHTQPKINMVYGAVIQFIKWYNSQTTPQ